MIRMSRAAPDVGVSSRGMSLPEMLVLVGMFGMLSLAVLSYILLSNRFYTSTNSTVSVQEEARRALGTIAVELPGAGGVITANGNQLEFQVALGYNQGGGCPVSAVCWGARDQQGGSQAGWRTRYRLSGTQLLREILDGTGTVQPGTRILTNEVSQATFSYLGGSTRTITVELLVQQTSPQLPGGLVGASVLPLVMRIELRNI